MCLVELPAQQCARTDRHESLAGESLTSYSTPVQCITTPGEISSFSGLAERKVEYKLWGNELQRTLSSLKLLIPQNTDLVHGNHPLGPTDGRGAEHLR